MMLAAIAAGCSSTSKKTPTASVTEPLAPAPVAYQPAPQPYTPSPVSAQPVTYDTTATPVAAATPAVSGGTYTVKHGDTLYSIAKSRYGSGKEYTKIIAANPGLSPQSLKAGQTINIP
jgi:nucleoid-associated protein YgaU